MYRIPIIIAASVFVLATLAELVAIEALRGSFADWVALPHRPALLTVLIGINAVQGIFFGYAAHRAALNEILRRRSEEQHGELTRQLRSGLRPALSIVQYAAYKTSDKQCIEICNEAIQQVMSAINTTQTQ